MTLAISIDNVSKLYRLGTVGTGTISHDLNRWWHRIRGKEDPYSTIGQVNDRTQKTDVDGKGTNTDYIWALNDVCLRVEQGEILGIIGRNGAGKSTLLKLLSRVTAPTKGSIRARGRIASLLEVGTGFHPELTGRENIYLNGAILGMKRQEVSKELDAITDFSGCAKYLDTPVKRYSSGMLVRLGFAVAAHLVCEILIVDEVLAVGDAEFQRRCIGKMQEVSQHAGRTVLFVSHNLASVEQLCTRGVLMQHGTVEETGPVKSIIDSYVQSNRTKQTDLKVRAEELPDQPMTLLSASLKTGANNTVTMGQNWEFDLIFNVRKEAQRPDIAIAIELDNETRITRVRSSEAGVTVPSMRPGRHSVRCIFHGVNLAPGSYRILIGVAESGGTLLEYVSDAMRVHVIDSNVLGGSNVGDQTRSLCFFRSDWSFKSES